MNPDRWTERAAVLDQLARSQREVAVVLCGIGDSAGADALNALAKSNDATAVMCREWAAENVAYGDGDQDDQGLMVGGVR